MSGSPSILTRLQEHAKHNPDRDAIVTIDYALSYAELHKAVMQQAAVFKTVGISSDTLIGINCPDDVKHIIMCLASLHIGATSYTVPSYEQGINRDELKKYFQSIREVNSDIAINPICVDNGGYEDNNFKADGRILFPTSGTTGKSKLVIHSGENIVAQAHRHINSTEERFACLASVEHNFSKRHRLYCIAQGATNIFLPSGKDSFVENTKLLKMNVLHVSAYQAQEMLSIDGIENLGHIKLKIGGSHVPASLRRQIRKRITTNLYAGYGTTETGAIAFSSPADPENVESVGTPLDGIDVRVIYTKNTPHDDRTPGELAIRCKGMFLGYLGRKDLYASRVKNDWFYTGDMGYFDKQGRIHLCGRFDDMFLFNSINIYPQELESDIREFSSVTDAAIIPKPSATHGEIPVALVVPQQNSDFSLSKLKKYMHQKAGIRHPRQYIVVEDIPRNNSGKVLRNKVVGLSNEIDKLRAIFCDELGEIPSLNGIFSAGLNNFKDGLEDIDLRTLDMDSLMRMELLVFIETRFDTIISIQELHGYRYLSEVITRISSAIQSNSKENNSGKYESNIKQPVFGLDSDTQDHSRIVRCFQRVFKCCHSVTQLNHMLRIYEDHLTPTEFNTLLHCHSNNNLIPSDTAYKFTNALDNWLLDMESMLMTSEKTEPEPYTLVKLRPAAWLFTGSDCNADKVLVVCFSVQGLRRITIPNTLLMQYADASRYDILIIGEPLSQGYMHGIPFIGRDEIEVIKWIRDHKLLAHYNRIRTIGSSAGSYPAILAGYYLKAELAMSAGGRFHSTRKYPGLVWRRILMTLLMRITGKCPKIIFSHSIDSRRDRKFAFLMSWITSGTIIPIRDNNTTIGHQFFDDLLKQGKLMAFFQKTIFQGD